MGAPSERALHILEDTRQHAGKHSLKHEGFERDGVKLTRSKLPFGDYCLPPKVSVDTKKDIYELYQDLTSDHARFKRECEGARDAGVQLIVLVENRHGVRTLQDLAEWMEPIKHLAVRKKRAPRAMRMSGKRLARACATMQERYGVAFRFCSPEESHTKIQMFLKWNGGGERE